jgi:hypothetical protein
VSRIKEIYDRKVRNQIFEEKYQEISLHLAYKFKSLFSGESPPDNKFHESIERLVSGIYRNYKSVYSDIYDNYDCPSIVEMLATEGVISMREIFSVLIRNHAHSFYSDIKSGSYQISESELSNYIAQEWYNKSLELAKKIKDLIKPVKNQAHKKSLVSQLRKSKLVRHSERH